MLSTPTIASNHESRHLIVCLELLVSVEDLDTIFSNPKLQPCATPINTWIVTIVHRRSHRLRILRTITSHPLIPQMALANASKLEIAFQMHATRFSFEINRRLDLQWIDFLLSLANLGFNQDIFGIHLKLTLNIQSKSNRLLDLRGGCRDMPKLLKKLHCL